MNPQIERVACFVQSHPGFYVTHNDRGVTLQIEVLDRDGSTWHEYASVWSIAGARKVLGY